MTETGQPEHSDTAYGLEIDRRNLLRLSAASAAALGALSFLDPTTTKAEAMTHGANNFYTSDRVTSQKVAFKTQYQMNVAGNLFTPAKLDRNAKHPTIVVGHPMGAVKEQSANLYARLWLEPSERAGELVFALAATVLRQRGVALAHLPVVGVGLRRGKFRWSPHQEISVRIIGLLGAFAEAAAFGQADRSALAGASRDAADMRGQEGDFETGGAGRAVRVVAAGNRATGGGAAAGDRGDAEAARRQSAGRTHRPETLPRLGDYLNRPPNSMACAKHQMRIN
jgi:hypothetical protein